MCGGGDGQVPLSDNDNAERVRERGEGLPEDFVLLGGPAPHERGRDPLHVRGPAAEVRADAQEAAADQLASVENEGRARAGAGEPGTAQAAREEPAQVQGGGRELRKGSEGHHRNRTRVHEGVQKTVQKTQRTQRRATPDAQTMADQRAKPIPAAGLRIRRHLGDKAGRH